MWKEYTNALLGLCVVIVAFLGLSGSALFWTLGVLGIVTLAIALWNAQMWQDYTNAVLGLCIAAVAFIGLTGTALAWAVGILGAVVLVLALSGAGAVSTLSEHKHSHA